jgi:hypothetical protein
MHAVSILATALMSGGATLVALAPAAQAETPQETIARLESEGYTVNVDRVGSAPLQDCVVISVRNPQTVTRLVRVENDHGHGNADDDDYDLVPIVVSRSISVSLNCT